MTLPSCLDGLAAASRQWLVEADMTLGEAVAGILGFGLLAAAAAAPLVAAVYSRRMRRCMAMREVADAPPAWWQQRLRRRRAATQTRPAGPLLAAVETREQRLRRATWWAYACFVIGGLPAVWTQADRSAGNILTVIVYVAAMALGPALVNLRPHRPGWAHWAAPLALAAIALTADSPMLGDELLGTIVLLLCLQLISVHRVLRAVVGPLMVVCSALCFAALAAALLAPPLEHCVAGARVEQTSSPAALLSPALLLALVMAAYAAAVALLRGVERLTDAGWLSDLSLVAASGLAVVAWLLLAVADAAGATGSLLTTYFVLWLGATAATYALVLRSLPCPPTGRTLLVLRVCSTDRRAERMLDALQTRWRLVGPVLEIGGPDLAKLNLDLHEVLALFTFRLPELLHPRGLPEAQFAASLDLAIDREGRFRINEVFCFDSSWQTMVERLMRMSDAILLDLRGFDARRAGTTHEVLRLAAIGALDRVVVVSDARTDWAHYDATVGRGGATPQALPSRIDATAGEALQQGFDALVAIAAR